MVDRIEILQEISGKPIAMERSAAESLVARLQSPEANEMLAAVGHRDMQMFDGPGGLTAVIPVRGAILHKGHLPPFATSTLAIGQAIEEATAAPRIKRIILDVDSPGGTVTGVPELAALIRKARRSKPITAIANARMASAAYWIGASASEIVALPSADVGSIGVYILHLDQSSMLEQIGLKATFIKAGKHKAEGNSLEPLTDEARAHFQKGVDRVYRDFVGAVAAGRGVSVSTVEASFGQGRVVDAREALKAGMIDRIATFSDALTKGTRGRGAMADLTAANAKRDRLQSLVELGAYDGADLTAARKELRGIEAEISALEALA